MTRFADEISATLARLLAYVATLALFGIFLIHFWEQWPAGGSPEPVGKAGWSLTHRAHPAFFVVSSLHPPEKTETYTILRHPEGGRKDVLHWAGKDGSPVAELEIYRPGGEFEPSPPASADLAARMGAAGGPELETAGVLDSKFGWATLFRHSGNVDPARSCLGFSKGIADPSLRISGWSCEGDTLPDRRAAIACTLNRLILLTAGNEPKLAELFAHAELRRASCAAPTRSADWVTSAENPRLRGAL